MASAFRGPIWGSLRRALRWIYASSDSVYFERTSAAALRPMMEARVFKSFSFTPGFFSFCIFINDHRWTFLVPSDIRPFKIGAIFRFFDDFPDCPGRKGF